MTNQDVFFLATEKGLVCWNFKEHRQFLLDYKHAARLIEIVYGKSGLHPDRAIDDTLIKYKVLVTEKNEPTLWGWDALSRIFHIGTRDVPVKHAPSNVVEWANAYTAVCAETLKSPIPPENHLDYATPGLRLPAPEEASKLDEIFSKRTTARNFFDTPVPLEIASTLLHCALGFLPDREHSPDNHMPAILGKRRCSPSSGGLNAVEGYLYARNISTLETGIYYYDPHHHALQIHERNLDHLGSLLAQQHFIDNLPLGIFFTARLDKLWWKYPHSKAYRMAIFEIGHIAQTFQLKATELGLKTWLTGALNENLVEKKLHLKHSAEQVLFFVGAGYSDGSAVPSVLTK